MSNVELDKLKWHLAFTNKIETKMFFLCEAKDLFFSHKRRYVSKDIRYLMKTKTVFILWWKEKKTGFNNRNEH